MQVPEFFFGILNFVTKHGLQLPTTKVEVFLEDLLASKVYFIRIPV